MTRDEVSGDMERRAFTRMAACGVAASLGRSQSAGAEPMPAQRVTRYSRALLTTLGGEALRAGALDPEEEYLFFYPFASTPCLLLDLGRPVPASDVPVKDGSGYPWGGGVGPRRSVVAFTAICPHQWTHPEKAFSPIGYHRTGEGATVTGGRDRLIVCCAHGSAFDPGAGGRVEQPPAELPLAAVLLSWDSAADRFFAEGVLGPDSFERFFREFRRKSRAPVEGQSPVVRLRDYSALVARC